MLYAKLLRERYGLILSYTGTILVGLGIIQLIPIILTLVYPNENHLTRYFLVSAFTAISIGFTLRYAKSNQGDASLSLQEGGVIVILSWVFTVLLSTLPFLLSGMLNFTQATFEAMSGWTTTGLSVIDVSQAPKSILLWRSIMQFFGGAGLMVVMLSAIIGPHGVGLYNAEGRTDKLLPNVRKSTNLILKIYSGYVIGGFTLYMFAGMGWFDAINHAIAALSTGGFSTRVDSIGEFNSISIELITIVLMLIGTTNFGVHYILLKGNKKLFFKNGEVRFLALLFAIFIPIVGLVILRPLFGQAHGLRIGAFELISALSTTGFSTVGYENWPIAAIFVMIGFMIIGGGTGSTAGGMKLYRVYLLTKSLGWEIKGYLLPSKTIRKDYVWRSEGKYFVTEKHIIQTANFAVLYMITYFIGVFILLLHGYPLRESMFEFASTISTVGLSMGITAPDAPVLVLWTQIFGMMLGRLEFIVIFFAGIKIFRDIRFMIKS